MGQPEGAQGRRWLVLAAMTGSLSMIFIDMTVVGVALPRIGAGLGMVDGAQAWIVTSYLLTLASLMALGGRMGDLLGKVRAFLAGVVLFAVASVVCADARQRHADHRHVDEDHREAAGHRHQHQPAPRLRAVVGMVPRRR
ncbi:MAG: hypothetical protein ACKOJI_11750, partial [Phycisphaerales bacterium]